MYVFLVEDCSRINSTAKFRGEQNPQVTELNKKINKKIVLPTHLSDLPFKKLLLPFKADMTLSVDVDFFFCSCGFSLLVIERWSIFRRQNQSGAHGGLPSVQPVHGSGPGQLSAAH